MADGHFPTLISKDRNANSTTNPIVVQLSDGTDAALIDGSGNLQVVESNSAAILADTANMDTNLGTIAGAVAGTEMQVDIVAPLPAGTNNIGDVDILSVVPGTGATNLGKAEDTAHTTGDTGVQMLAVRNDTQSALAGTTGDYIPLTTNSVGDLYVTLDGESVTTTFAAASADDSAFSIATDEVVHSGFLADETLPDSVDEGDVGIARMTLDRKQLMVLADATTDSQRLAIDASGNAQVDLAAVSVTAVPVSANSSANSETNPVYVQEVTTGVSGSEVQNYKTASALGSDTSDNHDYTVTGTTFLWKSVIGASSGGAKFECQGGPLASLTTKAVFFVPKHGGSQQHTFDPPIEIPVTSTGTARVIRTNRQGSAQDVYSTIIGNDV